METRNGDQMQYIAEENKQNTTITTQLRLTGINMIVFSDRCWQSYVIYSLNMTSLFMFWQHNHSLTKIYDIIHSKIIII